ncbi:MAG: nucleotidyltransferase family protein [Coriobacteriales bacterium]|nr:nucleotidyltransferase family protein [Coriobacteriales bacterium]
MSGRVDAVVLGGGDGEAIVPGVPFKGMVEVAGKPMLQWVVEAMSQAESVVQTALVVPTRAGVGEWAKRDGRLPVLSDASFIDNALAGVHALSGERPLIIATGDIPAITPEAIDDFVAQAMAKRVDLAYPLVRKEDMLSQFPGSERTFVPIDGGPITGGNIIFARPELIEANAVLAQKLFETRKSVVQWAMIIGPMFVARLVAGNLKPVDVEKKMAKITGGSCAAIYTDYASIGADIDKPWDLPIAAAALQAREMA